MPLSFTPPTHKLVRGIYSKYYPKSQVTNFGSTSTGAFYHMTGQFTGWITYIGQIQGFKGVRFYIKPSDPDYPITKVRVRIITDTYAGTVLADKTVDILTQSLEESLVEVEFDSIVANAGNDHLVLSWSSDGRSGVRGVDATNYPASDTPDYSSTFPKVRYFSHSDPLNTTSLQSTASQIVQYVEFFSRNLDSPQLAVSDRFAADLLKHQTFDTIFQTNFATTLVKGHAASVNWTYEAGAFSGFLQPIGAQQNFDQIKIKVRYQLSESPIRKIRCMVMRSTYDGEVLFDETIDVETQLGVTKEVTFTSTNLVVNSEEDDLFLAYFTDGKCGVNILPSIEYSTPWIRYSTASSVSNTATIAVSSEPSNKAFWYGLYRRENSTTSSTLRPEVIQSLGLSGIMTVDGEILMPSVFRMTEGIQMDVYFPNILRSKAKYLEFDIDVTTSAGGWHANDFWRLDPSGAASSTLTFAAYHRQELVAQKTSTLTISGASSGAGQSRKILMIGDSITAASTITGQIATRIAAETGGNFTGTLIGTKGPGSGNLHEGVSGKTYLWHFTDPSSPFYNPGTEGFDLGYYLTENSFTLGSGDWFVSMLGTNDTFNLTRDNMDTEIPVIISTLSDMIAAVQAEVSGIRYGICLTPPGCWEQNGFGEPDVNYGPGVTRWIFERNRCALVSEIIKTFGASEASNIYLIPTHAVLDVFHNFPTTTRAYNEHNATTETVQDNGLHPEASGGKQMGDCIYSVIKTIG